MNKQQTKGPIELVTDLLAAMTARAVEAERQLDEAKKSAVEWYGYYQDKDKALKETAEKLSAEIAEHQSTRQALREALDNLSKVKGDQGNG